MKVFLARIGAYLLGVVSAVWSTLIFVIDMLGRTTAGDAWNKLPEFLRTWPWAPPAAFVGLSLYFAYLGWPRSRDTQATGPSVSGRSNQGILAANSTPAKRLLSDTFIADGHNGEPPSFRGRFAENGNGAVFYVEHSLFAHGVLGPNGWTQPRKTEVFRQERFARGQSVVFPLVSRRETAGSSFWKIGVLADDTDPIVWRASYKGRVTILDANNHEQHIYFVLLPNERAMPTVLGQHTFDHILEWEGISTTTGDPSTLFK